MSACQLEQFADQSKKILENFSDRNKLKQQLLSVKENETLFSLSEHYDILDKIVLYADEKYRIRLHIFGGRSFSRDGSNYSRSMVAVWCNHRESRGEKQ